MSGAPTGGDAVLAPGDAALVRLSAALAAAGAGAEGPEFLRALEDARREATAGEVEEALLQSHLFLGYPAALNALARWRAVTGDAVVDRPEASRRGGAPGPGEATGGEPDDWTARGEEVCKLVYAGRYDGLRAHVRALHPDMERWMVRDGYGRVLGRPGLSLAVRELCVVAVLAVVEAPRQLYAHLRGALNVGVAPAAVDEALGLALAYAEVAAKRVAEDTWQDVRRRVGDGSTSARAGRSD